MESPTLQTVTCPNLINDYIHSLGFNLDAQDCDCKAKRKYSKPLDELTKMVISLNKLDNELRVELRVDMVRLSKKDSERLSVYQVDMDEYGKISVSELMRVLAKVGASAIVFEQSYQIV